MSDVWRSRYGSQRAQCILKILRASRQRAKFSLERINKALHFSSLSSSSSFYNYHILLPSLPCGSGLAILSIRHICRDIKHMFTHLFHPELQKFPLYPTTTSSQYQQQFLLLRLTPSTVSLNFHGRPAFSLGSTPLMPFLSRSLTGTIMSIFTPRSRRKSTRTSPAATLRQTVFF